MSGNPDLQPSKALACLLRHHPAAAGLQLDNAGWIDIDDLIEGMTSQGYPIAKAELDAIINQSTKKRYEVFDRRIRAAQGHSMPIDLKLEQRQPPELLFHGTVDRFLANIVEQGLLKGQRTHVHLSADLDTATTVGTWRGKPIILTIDAGRMHRDGHRFIVAANGVWLADHVPARYLNK